MSKARALPLRPPCQFRRVRRRLIRRSDDRRIPDERVTSVPSFDAALALENRLDGRPGERGRVARWRTRHFDRCVARSIEQAGPDAVLLFSDVGSEFALPACRNLGIPSVLSMVHGDVRRGLVVVLGPRGRLSRRDWPLHLSISAMADSIARR